jgi:hypothetical protein
MTKHRNSFGATRRGKTIYTLRQRDGDTCVHCGEQLDFTIDDPEHPAFATIEHYPIPWRECRSHDQRWLKLAHRFCNEGQEIIERIREGTAQPRALRRYIGKWKGRAPPDAIPAAALIRADHLA